MTDRLLAFGSFEEVDPAVNRWCFRVDSVQDERPPGARGWYTNTGHRDKTYGLAEISSTSPPTACRRSTRAFLNIDCAEELLAPLLLGFYSFKTFPLE